MGEWLSNKWVQLSLAFAGGMIVDRIMFGGNDAPQQVLPAPAPQIEGKKKKKKKNKDAQN